MELNLGMIMELLSFKPEHETGDYDGLMTLHGIQPIIPGAECGAADLLYLAPWDNLMNVVEPPNYVICCGGGEDALSYMVEHKITGAVLERIPDPLEVLVEVQKIFVKYYRLERSLLEACINDASDTRTILNCCAEFFKCHVALFGADFQLLDYSNNHLPAETDQFWHNIFVDRQNNYPMLTNEKVHMKSGATGVSPRSHFIDLEGSAPHFVIAFDQGNNRIATLVVYQTDGRLTPRYHWLVDYIADMIYPLIIDRYSTFLGLRNNLRNAVVSVLRHSNSRSALLKSHMQKFGWNQDSDYRIILIALPAGSGSASHFTFNYENVFAEEYSECLALHIDDFIFILLHNQACKMVDRCTPALDKQLTIDNGRCIVSHTFCSFTDLRSQYELAKAAFQFTQDQDDKRITCLSDIIVEYAINTLSSVIGVQAICHNAAVRIHEYDKQNGTEFLLTLETYLLNNKSLIAASGKLFIHRSTMTYRLKCIEDIVELELGDPNERLQILLSCIILRTLDGSENTPRNK
jgi:sugar diacid utilization regulator